MISRKYTMKCLFPSSLLVKTCQTRLRVWSCLTASFSVFYMNKQSRKWKNFHRKFLVSKTTFSKFANLKIGDFCIEDTNTRVHTVNFDFRLLRSELSEPDLSNERRLEVLRLLRDTEEELLSALRRQKAEIERQNANMERALHILAIRRFQNQNNWSNVVSNHQEGK